MKTIHAMLTWLALPILLIGCATTPPMTASDLTVQTTMTKLTKQEGSLTVASVKSDNQSAHHRKPIDVELFREALSVTLQESEMFASVSKEPGGDFTLESEIIYQAPIDAYSVTVPLLVHYKLRDARVKKVVWKENTFSQPSIPYKKSEAGLTGEVRHNSMVRAAVQDSFNKVLDSMYATVKQGVLQ
ncbi:MAG: hypothetical protein ACR2QW_06735 [bacterium]